MYTIPVQIVRKELCKDSIQIERDKATDVDPYLTTFEVLNSEHENLYT